MKKLLLITLLITLLFTNVNCGGGFGSSNTSGKTMVHINIGNVSRITSSEKSLSKTTLSVPSHIVSIRFTITAPDITTIIEEVSVAGKESISVKFEILNGTNRRFLIEALDISGNVLYRHTTFENLIGEDIHLNIEMEPTDKKPPEFKGLTDIKSIETTSLTLSWEPAIDDVTTQDKIQYLIYRSNTPEGEDFASPDYTTTGETFFDVTGLNPATTYYFVVRSKDETGNIDKNSDWKIATTLIPPDTTAPVFDGVASVTAVSTTELNLSWSPAAVDDRTASPNIIYYIYMSTTPGGKDPESPNFETVPGATSYSVTGLSPDTTYFFIVRAKDEAGNIDPNSIERSATTLSPLDTTAPDFGGLVSVAAVSTTSLYLSWNAAVDTVTASSNIVYNIYRATKSGGENLAVPGYTTASGATSYSVTGLSPGTTYYYIVRAKDEAGNIDDNIVEKSGTTQSGIDLKVSTNVTNPCAPLELCPELEVTVSNTGNINASSVKVYYIYEYCIELSCYPICGDVRTIDLVAAYDSVLDLYSYYTTHYFVIVDPLDDIPEINESNNEKCSDTTCFFSPDPDICSNW